MAQLIDPERFALSLLFQRMNWPVPMVRWRAAKQIRNLLNAPDTRDRAITALLSHLEASPTESEACSFLTILMLTDPAARPASKEVEVRLQRPSVLSSVLLKQIYDTPIDDAAWSEAHSGTVPDDFKPDQYFEEHKSAHVPPIFRSNLRRLERNSGLPFIRQWAFEWKTLQDRLQTRYTRYAHYFDDTTERGSIVGQYQQRQSENFRSAYLRVIALAVSKWRMPVRAAIDECLDSAPAIAGLFELEPVDRPAWLSDIPERCLAPDAGLQETAQELSRAGTIGAQRVVSLRTPFRADMALYGDLELAAFFVTDDFQPRVDRPLYEPREIILLREHFDLQGQQLTLTADELAREGESGIAVPVCISLFPIPYGYWQGDHFSVGLTAPASYCLPATAVLKCTASAIEVVDSGTAIASTQIWHDQWTPRYPRENGSTRCGVVTMLDAAELAKAQAALGLRLAWFIKRRVWTRETDYGAFRLEERRALCIE